MNNSDTTVILSIGGNDILIHYVDKENDTTDTSVLGSIFAAYKNVVKSIQNKLPLANIVLLDIYYPENMTYKQYHSILNEWNKKLYNYADEPKKSVLKVSKILTSPQDFTFGIEPSAVGGKKLVEEIMTNY